MPIKNNHKQDILINTLQAKVDFTCEKVSDLNAKTNGIDAKVDKIISNHLPHIEVSIAKLDANQKIILTVMFMVIAGLIGLFFK